MDWIFDNIQIALLVLLALGSLVKSLIEKASGKKKEEEVWEEEEPEGQWQENSPSPYVPPPLPRGETSSSGWGAPPPLPTGAQVPVDTSSELQHQQDLADRLRKIRAAKAAPSAGAAATKAKVAARQKNVKVLAATSPTSLRGQLKNRSEVRRAIVMREILGPPVSLR